MTPTEQEKDWEESYQIQKLLTASRVMYVTQIASDIQHYMIYQNPDGVDDFIKEAKYHLDKSVEEGLIEAELSEKLKSLLDEGQEDYRQRYDQLLGGEVAPKKWDEFVQKSLNYVNRVKVLLFPYVEKIGFKNMEDAKHD